MGQTDNYLQRSIEIKIVIVWKGGVNDFSFLLVPVEESLGLCEPFDAVFAVEDNDKDALFETG